ncbi:MAG: ABC transporter substrate-binding protein [Spirochaetes bacterium]|nr:ABC transporter substrate-binding protein [Spirochaetota bacterium]
MYTVRKTGIISRAAAFGCSVLLALCSLLVSACDSSKPVRIGLAASFSGKDYMLGVDGRNAIELFVHQVNSGGGVHGRPIELHTRDLTSSLDTVLPSDTDLIEAGVEAIIGHFTSSEVEAALSLVNKYQIPLLSPAATSESLSGKDDYFFRTVMSSRQDGTVLADHMKQSGYSDLLIISTALNPAYVNTYTDGLYSAINVVADLRYTAISEINSALLATVPPFDCVLIIGSSIDTGTIAQTLKAAGLEKQLYASGWAGNDDLIEYGGRSVENLLFVHQINPELPDIVEFSKIFKDVYGSDPGYGAIEAWDTMLYLHTVLLARKPNEKLYDTIKRVRDFQGISGHIYIDTYGDASRPLYLKAVENGRIAIRGIVGD